MELFQVTLEFANLAAPPDPSLTRRGEAPLGIAFPRKKVTTHVAVYGSFGADMVARAAQVAVDGVVGKDADPEKWQPVVMATEFIGTVHVEEAPDA